ncbi:aldehyde ferredoxin oxidoreductase family protein [Thermodesulfobacteriota bacterium]
MANWHGWAGNILRVDLSNGKIEREPLTEDLAHNYVGGRGINSKILYDETGPETDPLGPDNRLIIGTGPTSGTMGLGTGRFTVTCKSPLTGILGDASGGGHFGAEVKFAGYDHIIIQGKSKKPVYLWINDDKVEIRDAQHLWGKTTWEAAELIREELGDRDIRNICIGPAGENLVNYAFAIADDERVPAETGTGTVMGSKNLKAISVRGSRSVTIAHPEKYYEIIKKWYDDVETQQLSATHRKIGSAYLVEVFQQVYNLAINNSQKLHVDDEAQFKKLTASDFLEKYLVRSISCFGCRHGCQKFVQITDGPFAGEKGMRPEYGPTVSLCSQLGVFEFAFSLQVTNLCNQYGLDAQEAGPTIAMAMECYQRKILKKKDTDGLRLVWGDKKVILELIRKIAHREGFGDILAEGCYKAAQKIGGGAEKYAYHIKGKAHPDRLTAYIPCVLGFALASRGWDHLRGSVFPHLSPVHGPPKFWDYDPMYAEMVTEREHIDTGADCLEICKWLTEFELMAEGSGGIPRMAEVLSAITGVDYSKERLTETCERVYNLERAYNLRMGLTRDDDIAPHHFYDTPIMEGPSKGMKLDREKFEGLKDVFYELRGGEKKTGAPTRETLEKLNMKNVADDLEKIGIYK